MEAERNTPRSQDARDEAEPGEQEALTLGFSNGPAETRCPYCHDVVLGEGAFVVCRACLAPQHSACWEEHQACASCESIHAISIPARTSTAQGASVIGHAFMGTRLGSAPPGDRLQVAESEESLELSWSQLRPGLASGETMLAFCALVFGTLVAIVSIKDGSPEVAIAVAWISGVTTILTALYAQFMVRGRPWRLTLDGAGLELDGPRWWGGRRRRSSSWSELGSIHCLRSPETGDQRLSFDFGNERVNIDRTLYEPEREWLYEELMRWRARCEP